jgi:serralysin
VAIYDQNAVRTTDYVPSLFPDRFDALLCGTKWGDALGTGVTLTYSLPLSGGAFWAPGYQEGTAWYVLEDYQMAGARKALASWAAVANVRFQEVTEDAVGTVGEIRFAFSDYVDPWAAAHAYLPSDNPWAGDIWFNLDDGYTQPTRGSFFYNTMIHEIGHALGLQHSFDDGGVAPGHDNYFYTVMSYTASPWSAEGDNYASFYPTTPMYLDILALQAIYGKPANTNAGNTTYSFTGGYYFETIVDTGGNDTIVYSGNDTCLIDLREGAFSQLSRAIQFSSASSRATVAIGPDTVIENARGGGKNDKILGNDVANQLIGNAGRDTIKGGAGNDIIIGGAGKDRLQGDAGNDRFDFNKVSEIGTSKHDVIFGFKHGQDDIDLSTIDANANKSGNNKFSFKSSADSSLNGKAGELCWYKKSGDTYVIGDLNGDRKADFILELDGSKSLTKGDFIL